MASTEWPDLAELKRVLNADPTSNQWDESLTRDLEAAIQQVKNDTGAWDDLLDEPTAKLAAAALRMAELIAQRGETPATASSDPKYRVLMSGHLRRFAIS